MWEKLYRRRTAMLFAGAGLAGLSSTPIVRADSVYGWGSSNSGQLGTGGGGNTPAAVSGLSSGVTAVAAGAAHSLVIQNGAVKALGSGIAGALGNGSTTNSSTLVSVAGLSSGVTAIAAGDSFGLAIQNGGVVAWGNNGNGELGNGSTINSSTPINVIGLSSGVTAIAGSGGHSLAIQNGGVKAWGWNGYGQLGTGSTNGPTDNGLTPVTVTGMTSGVTAIAAGDAYSLAIQNGAVMAWGANGQGELGNGTTTNSSTPVAVLGLTSGVTAIAAGQHHALAIKNGNVWAWGYAGDGALGNGATLGIFTPLLALDTAADFVAVAAGDESSYALSSDGSLWVWGFNSFGRLGIGPDSTFIHPNPLHLLPPKGLFFTGIDTDTEGFHVIATVGTAPPVPEPATVSLLVLGGIPLLVRRRRRFQITPPPNSSTSAEAYQAGKLIQSV